MVGFLIIAVLAGGAWGGGLQGTAAELYGSLTPEQMKKGALAYDDPARHQELFPEGVRAGIQLKDLTGEQRAKAIELLMGFTSEYGQKKARAVAGQGPSTGGLGDYYLAFFGRPGVDAKYAWRIAEHHLTLVDMEVTEGEADEFGPVLLGANPPTLWDEEEDRMMALYGVLTPEEKGKVCREGKGESAKPLKGAGVVVGELSDPAQKKVQEVYENRLSFYSDDIRSRIAAMVEKQGGIKAMRVAFWGVADKRCADGGKWDFKLGGENFLCDYENTRGHIHLSMKGKLAPAAR